MNQAKRRFIARWYGVALVLAFLVGIAFSALASPSVVYRTPARGEELQVDGFVELIFDHTMDHLSVETAWSTEPFIDGTFDWIDERTIRFDPVSSWLRDTVYRISLSQVAQSSTGETLASDYEFQFRTVGYLEISQMLPAANSEEIAVDSDLFVMFNRPVVPLMTLSDPGMTELSQPLIIEPVVLGTGEWVNTSIYVFTPTAPLRGGTVYTVTVPGG
ncbi:MAG: Ig-like domain-containing protein, partial [Candidatus Bipolaricaulota bacterium]